MLILKHLYLQDFMSIPELDIDFDDNEIISICGENGSGKSALLYAIAFLLTGYRQGESYRNYVKTGSEKSKLVLEAFLKDEPLYCEAEIMGIAKKGLGQPVKRKTIYKGITYLNGDHAQFIKENELDYAESLIFLFQDTGKDIINARPAERAAMLKRLFKFEFPDIVNKLKEKQESSKTVNIELTSTLNELKNRNFVTQPLCREIVPAAIEAWKERSKEVDRTLMQIGDINDNQANLIESKLREVDYNIKNTQDKIEQDNKELSTYKSKIEVTSKFIEDNPIANIEDQISQKYKDLDKHKEEYRKIKEEVDRINQKISIQNFEEKELKKQIEIGKTGVCHACGQAVGQDHVDKLITQKTEIEKELLNLKDFLVKLAFDNSDAVGESIKRDIRNTEDLLNKVKNEIKTLEYYKSRVVGLEELENERKKTLSNLFDQKEKLEKEKENYKQLEPLIKQKDALTQELKSLEAKINKAKEDSIKNVERKKNNELILREKQECENRVQSLNEKINNIMLEMVNTKTAIDIFESSFPSFLVLQATQKLEDYINEIVQRVFPYMKVKLQMQRSGVTFMYTAESSDEEWLPVVMSSGAQKAILSLAYKTSLARLYGVSCIMLDEVDASCDQNAASIIYRFIASLDTFQQIIFISHRPEAREAVKEVNPDVVIYTVKRGEYTQA